MVWRVNIGLQLLFSFPSKAPENLQVLLRHITSGKCFLEHSRGEQPWTGAVGNAQQLRALGGLVRLLHL